LEVFCSQQATTLAVQMEISELSLMKLTVVLLKNASQRLSLKQARRLTGTLLLKLYLPKIFPSLIRITIPLRTLMERQLTSLPR